MNFDALAQSIPGINEQAAKQQKAARDIMLQREIGSMPASATPGAAPQLAQGMAQQAGTDALQQQQAQQQQAVQAQQVSNAALSNEAQQQLSQRKMAQNKALADLSSLKQDEMAAAMLQSRKKVMDEEIRSADALQQFGIDQDNSLQVATIQQRKDLQRLGGDVKNQLIDSRIRFEKDEMGRKFTNERQLNDYILSNARTQQEFQNEAQELAKSKDQYILTLDMMEKKIDQALQQGYIKEKGDLDRKLGLELAAMKAEIAKKKQKEMANKRNNIAAWQAAGTIAGAVAGSVVPGVGTAAGATVGNAVGTVAGNQFS